MHDMLKSCTILGPKKTDCQTNLIVFKGSQVGLGLGLIGIKGSQLG